MLLLLLCTLAASSPAHAGDLHVGWADLGDPLVDGPVLGGQLSAGYRHGLVDWLSLEGRGTYLPDLGTRRTSGLVRTLVGIAEEGGATQFQQPLTYDLWRVEVLADFAPPRDPARTQAVPHLRLGLGLEGQRDYYAVYDPDEAVTLSAGSTGVGVPGVGEVAFELWSAHGFAVRLGAGLLTERRTKPQYDPAVPVTERQLKSRSRMGLDLVIALGGS